VLTDVLEIYIVGKSYLKHGICRIVYLGMLLQLVYKCSN
jgi:hypothetical protein